MWVGFLYMAVVSDVFVVWFSFFRHYGIPERQEKEEKNRVRFP